MQVGVIGVNFKTSNLKLHEAIAKRAHALFQKEAYLLPCPVIILSTCNRTEVYFSAENLLLIHNLVFSLLKSGQENHLNDCFYSYFNQDCFQHLCKVASGLDSAVFMETEIVRQIKTAYNASCNRFALPHALHYVFQKALKVAKSVRSLFPLQRGGPTLFQMLWQMAMDEFPDIQQRKILLVGYSETHRGLASFLAHKGVSNLMFCTRQPELVLDHQACDRTALKDWDAYDLISCASKSNDFLIQGHGTKRHLIFDLSIPRNVDPQVESKGVKLFNMEQLNYMMEQKKGLYELALEKSHTHLLENIERLMTQYANNKTRNSVFSLKIQRG